MHIFRAYCGKICYLEEEKTEDSTEDFILQKKIVLNNLTVLFIFYVLLNYIR